MTEDKDKYKDIEVYLNGRKTKRSDSWLSIGPGSDLCYISYDEGRVYFGLLTPSDGIADLDHNDDRQSVSFRYIGWWESEYEDGGENVNYLFEIVFNNREDYHKVREIWQEGEKIHPKEDLIDGFDINDYLSLKMVNEHTYLYINGRRFLQCIQLTLNIPKNEISMYDEIDSIDEASEIYKTQDETRQNIFSSKSPESEVTITPEQEFWAHCSNVQMWAENDYDTRLMHSNLSFPLLKELVDAGDPKAIKVFKEEIAKRFELGSPNVMLYLIKQGYTKYLIEDNIKMNILERNSDLQDYLSNNLQKFRYVVFPIYKFLINIGDDYAMEEFKTLITQNAEKCDASLLIKNGFGGLLPRNFVRDKIKNKDIEVIKAIIYSLERHRNYKTLNNLKDDEFELIFELLTNKEIENVLYEYYKKEREKERDYYFYDEEDEEDEFYFDLEYDFEFYDWRHNFIQEDGEILSNFLKKKLIKIINTEEWDSLADLVDMYLLNILTEDDFLDLVNDPKINFLENLLFCLQTTDLNNRLTGWERSLYDELRKFCHESIQPKLLEIMTTSTKIKLRTIVESFLIGIFEGADLASLFEDPNINLLENIIKTIKNEEHYAVGDWFHRFKYRKKEELSKPFKDSIIRMIKKKKIEVFLDLFDYQVIEYLKKEDFLDLLASTEINFLDFLINSIKNLDSNEENILTYHGIFPAELIEHTSDIFLEKIEELARSSDSENLLALFRLQFIEFINIDKFISLIDKYNEVIMSALLRIDRLEGEEWFEKFFWGENLKYFLSPMKEFILNVASKGDIEEISKWIIDVLYCMDEEEQVIFLKEPVFKKELLIRIAGEYLSWDGQFPKHLTPFLSEVYNDHLNEIRNSEAYKIIMPLYKKYRETPLTMEEKRKINFLINVYFSDYLSKLIKDNFPDLASQEFSELKHNIEKLYWNEKRENA